jgi:hypothetical protein
MKDYREPWRPDLKDRAKEDFAQKKVKAVERTFLDKVEFNLEKWTKLKLELKPDGPMREAVDDKLYGADWQADIDAAREMAEPLAEATERASTETSFSDLSGSDMAKLILADFNRQASLDQDGGLEL